MYLERPEDVEPAVDGRVEEFGLLRQCCVTACSVSAVKVRPIVTS